jgi:hypothetical protein
MSSISHTSLEQYSNTYQQKKCLHVVSMRICIIILALPKSVASRACACCESSAAGRWARSWWARQTRTGVGASATRPILPLKKKTQTWQVCVWTCVCVCSTFLLLPPLFGEHFLWQGTKGRCGKYYEGTNLNARDTPLTTPTKAAGGWRVCSKKWERNRKLLTRRVQWRTNLVVCQEEDGGVGALNPF